MLNDRQVTRHGLVLGIGMKGKAACRVRDRRPFGPFWPFLRRHKEEIVA